MLRAARVLLTAAASAALKETPLTNFHKAMGAKMVEFAGYNMPVQYKDGVLAEHLHCRSKASIFDVSHMGQVQIDGKHRVEFMESLCVADLANASEGKSQLSVFTNPNGGIIDDLIVTRNADNLYVVINAGCKDKDLAHMRAAASAFRNLGKEVNVNVIDTHALIALQGPQAMSVLQAVAPSLALARMPFMTSALADVAGVPCRVTRCGYTGEDGFEISVPAPRAVSLTETLLGSRAGEVRLAGLGARDSLRLEAGLCLYGHDIDETTSPVEAGLAWTISKRRRAEGGFPGFAAIAEQLKNGPARKRVGLRTSAPVREHTEIRDQAGAQKVGEVTSGTFSPSLKAAISMGYVPTALSKPGTTLQVVRLGKLLPATVSELPFVPSHYYKVPK